LHHYAGLANQHLRVGDWVELHSLAAKPEINGCMGEVRKWHTDKERYAVRLPTGTSILLKPANLKPASGTATTTASKEGTFAHTTSDDNDVGES
jgi:hypothetical protein